MKFEIFVYTPTKMQAFYKKAIAEYEKRLGRYGKISLQLIRKEKEWERYLQEAEEGYYVTGGSSLSSEELSMKIGQWENERRKSVIFFVDEKGLGNLKNDKLLPFSVSDFRINNAMTAMILYEQIYRGYRIMHNHPYHK